MKQLRRIGVFGPTLCGKTTLGKVFAEQYLKHKLKVIVLDINLEQWPQGCEVFSDEDAFWTRVWETDNALIIVDEASTTIARDKALTPVFTRLRHKRHNLIVLGHSGTDLLPPMRNQLNELYLFRQPEEAAKVWALTFADDDVLQCTTLQQYEFIIKESFKPTRRCKLNLSEKKKL